jgi:hypothetical protein
MKWLYPIPGSTIGNDVGRVFGISGEESDTHQMQGCHGFISLALAKAY